MEFNIDNCKVMHIGNSNNNFKYYMDNKELEMVQKEKDLGVLITDPLHNMSVIQDKTSERTKI